MDARTHDIVGMPRGGPDASWLSRRLQTDRLEYLDRDDVDDLKQKVVRAIDRGGRRPRFGTYEKYARMTLGEVSERPAPKILELGCGLGGLSRKLLELHPGAEVTITDIDPSFVADIAAGDLGSHPRATVRAMDATAIDAPDGYFDLALFALSLHHLPPELATRVFAEGTRAAKKLLIIDVHRPSPPVHLAMLAAVLPFTRVAVIHDAVISGLRAYSPSALRALAHHADPNITVELRDHRTGPTVLVASRCQQTSPGPDGGRID
ncbi:MULTISPECIES: class I SAM-dependent methyltransferase [unclassified Mycolicibacterium]|uniref:class I SAM-dependent methyltransferase n=1 Tax=unclassified Mycolicibacterium TaxID=2636767 RepID=UPI0012DD6600|nr:MULTISPECIES: class I SAM-dependent methyltransferase [unclassified Mycolicibacterium]MUL83971.1 class I SAM-dependent methyltransferase [Mycolicibacterium sp. CBMA 329]MUL89963.1 class I SAM-dependent methyltransferase [Mycolicibacterium sp. CBMA 331]MUL98016.1 class I SAM-dependent methyltransferase [Mycolicibacterium sp. CBMA 334]MUM30252.1 class I SAM-dependent methyltransferase [Mycolicibacterium sp. CBMA 295]MUM39478.1 class I SAM-dependent methyltransferase [Mycolicibacterium sp. CBM